MLVVLYPESAQVGRLVWTSSLVYIGLRLIGAAALIAFGTFMLRIWNPGRNEPREQREGAESAPVDTLVEVSEDRLVAETPELVEIGAEDSRLGSMSEARRNELATNVDPARAQAAIAATVAPAQEEAHSYAPIGPRRESTGLHVPRRTHRRIAPPPRPYRKPWDNPILWRELRTRAYGTKPIIIKSVFVLVVALVVGCFQFFAESQGRDAFAAWSILPVAILSLLLVNAQGVTALIGERDSRALDLLLVTELSPKQFIYGKLYGVLYNVKEMVLLPVLLTIFYAIRGYLTTEEAVYIIIDFLLLCHFAGMLGVHAALTYTNSRTAVANSLGVTFFLMAGILICACLIMQSDRAVGRQLLSFIVFIGIGSVALYGSLGARNPSQAIALVSILTPFWSFYCVISLLRGDILAAFLVSFGIYGFALAAMLVPAVSDFDIALGRTNALQG